MSAERFNFKKATTIALKDYLGLDSDETFLVVCDDNMREIGLTFFESGKKLCRESIYMEMDVRAMSGEEPPEQIAKMMTEVDAVLCPTTMTLEYTHAVRNASKAGVRIGSMPSVTQETIARCLNADADKLAELTSEIKQALSDVSEVHIESELGTEVTIPVMKMKPYMSTGVLNSIGSHGSLPAGEVFIAPILDRTNGKVVIDGSISQIGLLKDTVTIDFVKGFAEVISGKKTARVLSRILNKVGDEARKISRVGVGTNHRAQFNGYVLEDKITLGAASIGFGNNLAIDGSIDVPLHINCVIKEPTVYFDDKIIIEKGKLAQ